MTDNSPGSSGAPQASALAADPGAAWQPPRRVSRAMRSPLVRLAAVVAGIALGWGVFQAAHDLWVSRHDNTPVSSSHRAPSGALRVSGHGVTLTFPAGWVNVPTTPDEFAKFLREAAARYPHLRAALKSQLENMQAVRNLAMLAYRLSRSGAVTASANVLILPTTMPPGQLIHQLKGATARFGGTGQHNALTTFGKYTAVLLTYTLPDLPGRPAEYGAQAYLHGPSSTPLITVTTTSQNAAAILWQIARTLTFR